MRSVQKRLRATTIIPSHLYVERSADRQLAQIIDDMGRPGYVLVARQMGKTNLLINMKRNRERDGDLVIYIDLSNRSDTARALFRSIVDSILEIDPEMFAHEIAEVSKSRQASDLTPGIEYDRHLRSILRSQPDRRFIIVLDEIDSLVSSNYSDIFLAQVRSMYFSRANYSEYERLTYVLSGVAEPSDLIKDKNISPFNIGEKIYLEDFSRTEFSDFVEKAKLNLPRDVEMRVFEWVGGNPRMTWDVCSALEEISLTEQHLTPQDVDGVISRLYLSSFDRAPVDHIRVLAESDSQIRDAIVSIRYGKADALDEKTRSKLYLSGITRTASANDTKIKNRVIDQAISDAWLNQISAGRRSLLEAASDNLASGRYMQAVRLFDEAEKEASGGLSPHYQIEYGISLYRVGEYAAALPRLRIALDAVADTLGPEANYYIGACLLQIGDATEAIGHLEISAASIDGPLGPRIGVFGK
jgi:hypothetical protein